MRHTWKKVLTTGYPRQGPKNDTQNVKKRRKNAKTDSKTKEKLTPKFDVCILMSQNRREYNRSSDWSIKVKLSDLLGNYDRKADKPTSRQTDNVCIQNKSKETVRSNEESDAE